MEKIYMRAPIIVLLYVAVTGYTCLKMALNSRFLRYHVVVTMVLRRLLVDNLFMQW